MTTKNSAFHESGPRKDSGIITERKNEMTRNLRLKYSIMLTTFIAKLLQQYNDFNITKLELR